DGDVLHRQRAEVRAEGTDQDDGERVAGQTSDHHDTLHDHINKGHASSPGNGQYADNRVTAHHSQSAQNWTIHHGLGAGGDGTAGPTAGAADLAKTAAQRAGTSERPPHTTGVTTARLRPRRADDQWKKCRVPVK